jgi:hypothetical protein
VPFAGQVAHTGSWVIAPIAYGVGVAAAGCGDSRAGAHLEAAAGIADRLHAPVLADLAKQARDRFT